MGVPRGMRGSSEHPGAPTGTEGPPEWKPPRNWESVARSVATAHRRPGSPPRSGKARAKQRRERADARPGYVGAYPDPMADLDRRPGGQQQRLGRDSTNRKAG